MSLRVPKHQRDQKPAKRAPRHVQVATNAKTEPAPAPAPTPAPAEQTTEQLPSE